MRSMPSASLVITPPKPSHTPAPEHPTYPPSSYNLSFVIHKAKNITHLNQIHSYLIRRGLETDPVLNFKLQKAYTSLGNLDYATTLFKQYPNPNVYYYTTIIHSHALRKLHNQAFLFYVQMVSEGVIPNAYAFSAVLKGCPIYYGKCIHGQVVKLGFESDMYVGTALVDLYSKDGDVYCARKVFDRMPERSLLSMTTMMTGYAKNGDVDEARLLFDRMGERDVVCWNVMIDGYAQHGRSKEALGLLREMLLANNVRPNEVTVVAALSAVGQAGELESGHWIHAYVKSNGLEVNVLVGSALIDMYSKCGSLEDARLVFDGMIDKDVVLWNSMIVGYALHGFSREALKLFDEMIIKRIRPTDITFIGVLNACAHAGLVSDGWRYFDLMASEYSIKPKVEHYGCMVNLLGRAGHLEEAYQLIKTMKIDPDPVLWGTLLDACRIHKNVSLAEEIVKFLLEHNRMCPGNFVLLSNIYAAAGSWEGVERVRVTMKKNGILKEPGCSSIEVNNEVHEFLAGDLKHPMSKEIYEMLEEINKLLKARGYIPHTDVVLHDIDAIDKARSLEVHSERLALAFGLISTQPGSTVKIVKNLRVCPDCHTVMKLVSKITGRKIVMRDRNRFHHFANALCSCGDYW
ncbi:hypothetical protein LIER_04087 [Lithospermum erythrorhizon]|uniref:DYW domain-containing protein n=1 Tax=Lithospermum erythrorhizon TaxID=34254 RepID=A0AAV3NVL0_LITER